MRQGLHGHHDCALQDEGQGPPPQLPLLNALQQCLQHAQHKHCVYTIALQCLEFLIKRNYVQCTGTVAGAQIVITPLKIHTMLHMKRATHRNTPPCQEIDLCIKADNAAEHSRSRCYQKQQSLDAAYAPAAISTEHFCAADGNSTAGCQALLCHMQHHLLLLPPRRAMQLA